LFHAVKQPGQRLNIVAIGNFEFRISMVADELAPKLSFIIAKKDSEFGVHNTSSFFEIKFSFSLVERN
jgi:hypothetical protein